MTEPLPLFEPRDALDFFVRKGLEIGFSWLDVQREAHDTAFTVAKAMQRDLLQDIYDAVLTAIKEGQTLDQFRKNLRPILETKGWWGEKIVTDPLTGEQVAAQLGSPNRLRVIYRTNMRTSYASGRWARIVRNKKAFPFLRYVSVRDGRERPEHSAWHNTILPVDDAWWETHYPPCDWGCRCRALPLNQRMIEGKGLSVTEKPRHFGTRQWTNKRTGESRTIEKGIGAGWDYHPGKAALDGIAPPPLAPDFGEDVAAELSPDVWKFFFAPFGLKPGDRGTVFVDQAGWPVAIAPGMVRGRSVPGIVTLRLAAMAITDPDEIRWAWIRDQSDSVVLMRRFVRGRTMVDMGQLGWRVGAADKAGHLVWQRGDAPPSA